MMKRTLLRHALLLLSATAAAGSAAAQVKIGDNPSSVNGTALLEMESTDKGLLLPRLTNAQMTGIQNPATALMVWCTDCVPAGLRIYDGTTWSAFYTVSAPLSVVTSISCSGTSAGTYAPTVPMNASNTKTITFNGSIGNYTASTNTVNGVKFQAVGNKLNAGNETVVMTASGTPLANGTFTYTANVNGATCTFDITYVYAVYTCNSITYSVPTVNLVTNTSYTGTVTVPYTGGAVGQPISTTPVTSQGLSLTAVAGTYSSTGTITYNLSGIYTGTTTNPAFLLPLQPSCTTTIYVGGAQYTTAPQLNSNYSSFPGYSGIYGTYKVGQAMTSSNYINARVYVSSPGFFSASTAVVNGISFTTAPNPQLVTTPAIINPNYQNIAAIGTPVASGTFNYTLTDNRGQTFTFSVTFQQ